MAATETSDQDSELSEDIFQSVVVQSGGGSLRVTIPSEITHDLDINKGDRVAFYGSEGDDDVLLQKVDSLF